MIATPFTAIVAGANDFLVHVAVRDSEQERYERQVATAGISALLAPYLDIVGDLNPGGGIETFDFEASSLEGLFADELALLRDQEPFAGEMVAGWLSVERATDYAFGLLETVAVVRENVTGQPASACRANATISSTSASGTGSSASAALTSCV